MDTEANVIGSFDVSKTSILKNKEAGGTDLAELFDKMQIAVVGRENNDEQDSGISSEDEDGESLGEEDEYQVDPNINSLRHKKQTTMEERAQEDMDFPDEVDTPFKDARVRF